MNALHTKAICAVLFAFCSASAIAQLSPGLEKASKNEEAKGYWVIESNVKTPKQSVIHFYNMDHKLVCSETVSGRKLKVENRKTQRQLDEKTAIAVGLYEKMVRNEAGINK